MRGTDLYTWCIKNNMENLLKEWDYEKNLIITPHDISRGTQKKVWWKCEKGHEWETSVVYRTQYNRPCPICNGTHTLVPGINDLQTKNPMLASEWDYERNGDLTPNMVLPRSMKKVWWVCKKGHHFEATIDNRTVGSGCPICMKEKKTSLPEKTIYYYLKKVWDDVETNYKFSWLGKSEVDVFVPTLNLAIEYDGERWHKNVDKDIKKDRLLKEHGIDIIRFREPKCPKLDSCSLCIITQKPASNATHMNDAMKMLIDKINYKYKKNIDVDVDIERDTIDILNLYEHFTKTQSLEYINPELAKEWNYEKNGMLTPEKVYANAGIKAWWKCKEGHEWQSVIASRNAGIGCPFCSGKRVNQGKNDLQSQCPDVAKEWDYEKNIKLGIMGPDDISYSSNKKVWWKCYTCGFEWESKVNNRTSRLHTGCPACAVTLNKQAKTAKERRIASRGSLLDNNPKICEEWDWDNNVIKPSEVTTGSKYKAWWICPKKHHYQADVNKRTGAKPTNCPYCSGRKILKGYNDLKFTNKEVLCDWNYEKNEILPDEIGAGSHKEIWWKCHECGNEWIATPEKRCKRGQGCPNCRRKNENRTK